jgi:hypothetical protein
MRSADDAVLAHIDDAETLDLLRQLVRTASGNPPGNEAGVAGGGANISIDSAGK